MGDCGGNGKGVVIEVGSRSSSPSPNPSPIPSPDPLMMNEECWTAAEAAAQEVLNLIHPTLDSEEKRKNVIDYLQKLIKESLGVKIYPYGSVPLKTYLPDGDIDLTALSSLNFDEVLPQNVLAVLQREERNENTEFQVKDTQFIDAEVKLVKCLIQDIVVDISFNQLGGLCTLCFLEQVDQIVDNNHLFKRSILLVKSWCYYESRILGAHHGLISTYALETLVLYIFHLFHSSLTGPLKVLYIFLDYFSKFDWDNYCISLNGPVCKSSLPHLIVDMPGNGGNDVMLSEEFLGNCLHMFSVPCRGVETTKTFIPKHLNIVDPLKEFNNLGRSVHRGNFYRIRSAFKYGARKLGHILSQPRDSIADEIKDFYANTLERHGRKYGKDLPRPLIASGAEGHLNLSSNPAEMFSEDALLVKSSNGDFGNDSGVGLKDKCASIFSDELNMEVLSSVIVSNGCYLADAAAVSGGSPFGDANNLSTSSFSAEGATDRLGDHNSLSEQFAPHIPPLKSCMGIKGLKVDSYGQIDSSDGIDEKVRLNVLPEQSEHSYEDVCSKGSTISSPKTDPLETLSLDFRERDFASLAGDSEPLNPLSDLRGDYANHIRCLLDGRDMHGHTLSGMVMQNDIPSPSRFRSKNPRDTVRQSIPLGRKDSFSQTNSNFAYAGPSLNMPANSAPPRFTVTDSEERKARGTGPYIPDANCYCADKYYQGGRVRNRVQGRNCQVQRHRRNIGASPVVSETSSFENGSYDVPNSRSSVLCQRESRISTPSESSAGADTRVNESSDNSCKLEFGSLGDLPEILLSSSSHTQNSIPILSVNGNISKSALGKKERDAEQLFQLKNEEEFPPLSV